MAPTAANEEAELLARLQAQFGDLNVDGMLNLNGPGGNGHAVDSSVASESSLEEPTDEELRAWQEAQFEKGRMKLEAKKIREGACDEGNIHKSALQRRRQKKSAQERVLMREHEKSEADEWEHLPSAPDLGGVNSVFFPTALESDDGELELAGGVNPLLQKLANADPDVLGTKWHRLFSSADGDGLAFRNLLDKVIGYDGPTVLLIGGTPSPSRCVGTGTVNERVSLGFFTTDSWQESPEYFGSSDDCFLFSLDHKKNEVQVIRPKSTQSSGNKRFLYCHPNGLAKPNQRRKASKTNGSVHGIGIGGTASQPRLHLSESLEECRALEFDALFVDGDLLSGRCQQSLFYFDVDCIELFGVGGEEWISHALQARAKAKEMKDASIEKARKVDKRHFLEHFESGLTSGIKPGIFGHRDLAEERCDA